MIGLETPNEVLFDKATFIRREVIIALDRFYRHLEAHEGFLMYVIDGTKPEWSPRVVHQELKDQVKSIKVLKIRTEQIRSRAQGLSDLVSEPLGKKNKKKIKKREGEGCAFDVPANRHNRSSTSSRSARHALPSSSLRGPTRWPRSSATTPSFPSTRARQ